MIGLEIVSLIVLLPIIGSAFIPFEKYSAIISSSVTLGLAVLLAFHLPVISQFYVTHFTWYFIIMVSGIYLLSSLYSIFYLKMDKVRERNYYYFLNMFASSMFFTLTVNNLGLMWVGLEATTISSVLLVTIEGTPTALEAGWRYLIIVSSGVTFAFISVILFYYGLHSLTLTAITYPHESPLLSLASVIALIGFGTKAGVFPVNTWLPDAHSEAPPPISALFSGVLLPVAVYILHMVFTIAPLPNIYSWTAVISILVASLMMASQRYYKRLFAYSTIENMNMAILGISVHSEIGVAILLLTHAFGKAGGFYASGAIFKVKNSKLIAEYGLYGSPALAFSLLMSSLSVTGAPPFGNFIGEFLILASVLHEGLLPQFWIAVFSLSIAFISMNYHISRMIFKGEPTIEKSRILSLIASLSVIVPLIIGIVGVILI